MKHTPQNVSLKGRCEIKDHIYVLLTARWTMTRLVATHLHAEQLTRRETIEVQARVRPGNHGNVINEGGLVIDYYSSVPCNTCRGETHRVTLNVAGVKLVWLLARLIVVSYGRTTTKHVSNISCGLKKKWESCCKVSTLDHRCLMLSGKTSVWIIARLISLPAVPFLI